MTESQQRAIRSEADNLLILAVAGAGKTMCVVERIAWMIESGIEASGIIAIAFTISAAGELQRRLNERLGKESPLMFTGTVHSLCLRILKEAGRSLTVMSEREEEEMIGQIYFEACPTKGKQAKVSRKALDVVLKKGPGHFEYLPAVMSDAEKIALMIWQRQSETGVYSYDSLLYAGWKHIQKNGFSVQAIHWDEWQDSSDLDVRILEAIEAKKKTLIADENQAIFGFRGGGNREFQRLLKNAVRI